MAHTVHIDSDEGGFYLDIEGEIFYLADPEQLYDQARSRIGPWLRERDEAWGEFKQALRSGTGPAAAFVCRDIDESGGYDVSDPKHPAYHSVHADLWDMRERNPDEYEYLRTEAKREAAGE